MKHSKHSKHTLGISRAVAYASLALALAAGCARQNAGMTDGVSGASARMDGTSADRMLDGWSPASREAYTFMTGKYGPPAEMTTTMAMWNRTGPWKRTIIMKDAIQHNFPGPHSDVMEQVIDYRVPPDMADELAMYDGSVIVERTKGELSARCDKEGANFLALNLAHEIVTGRRTVADARKMYGEEIMKMKAGQMTSYTSGLMLPMMGGTADPDRPPM